MRAFFASLAVTVTAASVSAADLNDRYTAMGEMTVAMGDTELTLVIPYDTEKNRPYAEQKMIMGSFLTINTVGQVVDQAGQLSRPMVQVTLQGQGGNLSLLSAEIFDEQGYDAPLAMGADGGSGQLTSFSLDDDTLQAEVQGEFLRLTGYMKGTPARADGAMPQPATIRWQVTLPALK